MNRRSALKYFGALGAAAAAPRLFGCGSSQEELRVAEGLTTLVSVCMENRSYDHYLGARSLLEGKPGDGLRPEMVNQDTGGQAVRVFHSRTPCIPDPPHGWNEGRVQFADGQNSGFIRAYQQRHGMGVGPEVMGYFTREELPVTWALADAGVVCDRWFCSMMGPTWPNRFYLHSAQSGGLNSNELTKSGRLPWPTIFDRLNDAGVPWAYYYSSLPVLSLWQRIANSERNFRPFENAFFEDAEAGRLPPVVHIDPAFFTNDDHPPLPPILGQQFLASVYNALSASPQWPNILLVITYDEHGGFFDHVAPPMAPDDLGAQGFGQLGFRVPALAVGPYVRAGGVSSQIYDHTSILAHIEKTFSLPPLTARDAGARDLSDVIDQERLAARDPRRPTALPSVTIPGDLFTGECGRLKMRG